VTPLPRCHQTSGALRRGAKDTEIATLERRRNKTRAHQAGNDAATSYRSGAAGMSVRAAERHRGHEYHGLHLAAVGRVIRGRMLRYEN
jgi:hypothetical protein